MARRRQIDNGKALMAKLDRALNLDAVIVWAAMTDGLERAAQRCFRDGQRPALDHPHNPAHSALDPPESASVTSGLGEIDRPLRNIMAI